MIFRFIVFPFVLGLWKTHNWEDAKKQRGEPKTVVERLKTSEASVAHRPTILCRSISGRCSFLGRWWSHF
jgi:hypothetical protein